MIRTEKMMPLIWAAACIMILLSVFSVAAGAVTVSVTDESGLREALSFAETDGGGIVTITGSFEISDSLFIPDNCILVINKDCKIKNFGEMINAGTIKNHGGIENGGEITNSGTLRNHGGIRNNGEMTNSGTLRNNGGIANAGTIQNDGMIENDAGIVNSGPIVNNGMIENNGGIVNAGSVVNNGTIKSSGGIVNAGPFANEGTVENDGGIINAGSVTSNGTITGPSLTAGGFVKTFLSVLFKVLLR